MYHIYKGRIYIKNPSEAPKNVKVETGERGGYYYESGKPSERLQVLSNLVEHLNKPESNVSFYEDDNLLQIRQNGEFIGEIDYLPVSDGIGRIKNINIKSDVRNQGWGRKLVSKLENKLKASGAKEIVTSSVAPKAEEFWNKLGYRQIEGTRIWRKELSAEIQPNINLEITDNVPQDIARRYVSESNAKVNPIPSITFKEMISNAAKPIQKDLEGIKIFLMPYGMDAWGFADPFMENVIFIPQYDKKYLTKSVYDTYGMDKLEKELDPVLLQDEKKIFSDWRTLTRADAIQKTLLHEKGHIDTYKLLKEKSGYDQYKQYWRPQPKYDEHGNIEGWDYDNIKFFFQLFKEYISIPRVTQLLDNQPNTQVRAYLLGEMIAEDLRLLKGGRQSMIPNRHFWYSDYTQPEIKVKRHEALKKVFGW